MAAGLPAFFDRGDRRGRYREEISENESSTRPWHLRDQRFGLGTLVAGAAIIVFVTWFVLEARSHSTANPGATAARSTQARGPEAATPSELKAVAASLGHPVYWIGPRANTTYELTVSSSGQVLIRYLPTGVPVGTKQGYLTIATYPFANAFAVTSALNGGVTLHIPQGGIAEYPNGQGNDIHLAYPGGVVQVEVFDPSPTVPPQLVSSGAVVPV